MIVGNMNSKLPAMSPVMVTTIYIQISGSVCLRLVQVTKQLIRVRKLAYHFLCYFCGMFSLFGMFLTSKAFGTSVHVKDYLREIFLVVALVVAFANLVLKDKIIVYDLADQRIGWANYDCSLSVNVSATTSTGKSEFVNAGQLAGSSSSRNALYKLIPSCILAFLLHISVFGSISFL
ncbi:unnamed protein product [Ilex paraguariensis]|uniref:CASP-like protein n=1 Tax=Ilex paraguariensis TaxID=185542 RepID=A0ABC8V0E5_9AQUA